MRNMARSRRAPEHNADEKKSPSGKGSEKDPKREHDGSPQRDAPPSNGEK
jgi:hypothetical protein